jgi:hypothetical protein
MLYAHIAGLLQPLQHVNDLQVGLGVHWPSVWGDDPLQPGDEWRFPELEKAVEWIRENGVLPQSGLDSLRQQAEQKVLNSETPNNAGLLQSIKDLIADSHAKGLSVQQFQAEAEGKLSPAKAETLYRTSFKQATLAGSDDFLKTRIGQKFGYFQYYATQDIRTRPWHLYFDGWVAQYGTPLYYLMLQVQGEWSCRCSHRLLREDDAKEIGIKTMADVDPAILAQIKLENYAGD